MTRLVVKTDGGEVMPLDPPHVRPFDGLDVEFREVSCTTEEAVIRECRDAVALLVVREPITARVLAELRSCLVVARFGVGLDTVDVEAAHRHDIRVTNVPDANVAEVATHTMAMILSLVRRLPQFDTLVRSGEWGFRRVGEAMRRPDQLVLGLVGFGRVGQRVSAAASALGFRVRACDPAYPREALLALGAEPADFGSILRDSDILSLHLPLTDGTRGLIGESQLAEMKPGAVLINTSRGGLVDEQALAMAIADGRLAGAAVDAFEHEPLASDSPLRSSANTILSPHVAFYSREAYNETIAKAIGDVARVLRDEEPVYAVVPAAA